MKEKLKDGIFLDEDNQRVMLPKTHLPELFSAPILAKSMLTHVLSSLVYGPSGTQIWIGYNP